MSDNHVFQETLDIFDNERMSDYLPSSYYADTCTLPIAVNPNDTTTPLPFVVITINQDEYMKAYAVNKHISLVLNKVYANCITPDRVNIRIVGAKDSNFIICVAPLTLN